MPWFWFPEGQEGVVAQLRRGAIQKVDDSGSQQILKKMTGLKTEQFEDVYRPQPHGFSSHPPKDSEGVFISLGGRSDRLLMIGGEHKDKRFRDLKEGEVVVYLDRDNYMIWTADNILAKHKKKVVSQVEDSTATVEASKITLKSPKVVVDSPDINLGGEGGIPVKLCDDSCATKVKAV